MVNRSEVESIQVRKSDDLCKIAEMVGYKETGRFAINQLQCDNGAFVSSLLRLLDDNPDLMDKIQEWILENSDQITDDEPTSEYQWDGSAECKQAGDHLKSCDDDGYCNACGEQDE